MKRFLYAVLRGVSALQHFFRERLTPAGWLVLGAAGAAAALGVDTTRTMSYQAFAFLAALLCVAFLGSLFFRARIAVSRELPRYATAGERLEYRVSVENLGARPLAGASIGEALRDPRPGYDEWRHAREPGEARRNWFDRAGGYFRWRWLIGRRSPERAGEQALPELPAGSGAPLKLWLKPRRRGRIELAGMTLTKPDPLGLVRSIERLAAPARVVALPRRYRLPALALPGQRRFQLGGVTLAASVGDSEEFLGLREYRPGDPLQRVHWKSYARTGAPVVKEYQDEFFERHALVLDTSSARGEDACFEEAVSLAASFVYAIDTRECLLDLLLVGGEVRTYTAGRGQMQVEHMLEVLAGVGASRPEEFAALARALLAQRGALTSCILVLLSWDEARRDLVAALRASGIEVRVLLVCERAQAGEAPQGALPLHPGEIEPGLARLQ